MQFDSMRHQQDVIKKITCANNLLLAHVKGNLEKLKKLKLENNKENLKTGLSI